MTELIQHFANAVSLGSLYAVLAIGIALIFGIMNLINFAYGETIALGAYALFVLHAAPWPIQFAGCLIVAVVAAVLMERLAFRPFRGASAPVLLVTSFALSFALQSILTVIFESRAQGIAMPGWLSSSIEIGSISFSSLNLITLVAMIVLVGGLSSFLSRSMVGIQMRAAAENFSTAQLVGVKGNRVIAAAFALSGLFAGVAAILLVAQGGTVTPTMGTTPVLVAFVATILGGLGSLYGAAWGGFLLGVTTVVLQVALPDSALPYREALLYAGVVAVLILRPQGLIVVRNRFERV